MFGLNDNDSQTNPADTLPAAGDNPFNDGPPASPAPEPGPQPPAAQDSPATPTVPPADDNLLDLKQQALHSLQPLVSHLDQTPEEKFKTTMMLIQATDNSALVSQAYQAASEITDEKARAQALLDVVNEINYFTQHDGQSEAKT